MAADTVRHGLAIVVDRPPSDTTFEAFLERSSAWCVVAAQTERHHSNPAGIDVTATLEVVDAGPRSHFGLRTARQPEQPQCSACAGVVHDEQRHPAAAEFLANGRVDDFLGDV